VYFCARDGRKAGAYTGSAVVLSLAPAVVMALLGVALTPTVLRPHRAEITTAGQWYFLLVVLMPLAGLPTHAIRGCGRFVVWNVLRLLPNASWAVILILAWCSAWRSPTGLAYSYLIAVAAMCVPTWLAVRRVVGHPSWDPSTSPPLLRYALPAALATICQTFGARIDQLWVLAAFPPDALGSYAVASTWASLLSPAAAAVGNVVFPGLARLSAPHLQVRLLGRAARSTVVMLAALVIPLAVATPFLIPLAFGRRFATAVLPGLILLGGSALAALSLVLAEALRGFAQQRYVLIGEVGRLVGTGLAILLLAPGRGLTGVALATALGAASGLLIQARRLCLVTGASPRQLLLPTPRDVGYLYGVLADTIESSWSGLRTYSWLAWRRRY
jgi:O-antigen/teichoic acid export membrane protein